MRITTTELIVYSPPTRWVVLARWVRTILHEWSANRKGSTDLSRL